MQDLSGTQSEGSCVCTCVPMSVCVCLHVHGSMHCACTCVSVCVHVFVFGRGKWQQKNRPQSKWRPACSLDSVLKERGALVAIVISFLFLRLPLAEGWRFEVRCRRRLSCPPTYCPAQNQGGDCVQRMPAKLVSPHRGHWPFVPPAP